MHLISKEIEFDAGHRVPSHNGKCRSPHGHRYKVRLYVAGSLVTRSGASNEGMVADFGDIKSLLTEYIHDPLDHSCIIYENDFTFLNRMLGDIEGEDYWKVIEFPYIPTAENLSLWCFEQLVGPFGKKFADFDMHIHSVEVWETPTSMATYFAPIMTFPIASSTTRKIVDAMDAV